MNRNACILTLMTILLCSCKSRSGSGVKNGVSCPGGDIVSFTIAGLDSAEPLKFRFPELPDNEFHGVPPSSEKQVELDICYRDESDFSVGRVRILDHTNFFDVTEPEMIKVDGLAEALFGDTAQLDVLGKLPVPANMASADKFLIRSWKSGDTSFVTFDAAKELVGKLRYANSEVSAGDFAQGEGAFPSQSGECGINEELKEESFKVDTAQFKTKFCEYMTIDRSAAIKILWASMTDDNPDGGGPISHEWALPADFTKPDGGFLYTWTHHNMHDTLKIKLDEATYSMKYFNFPTGANRVIYEATYSRTNKTVSKTLTCPGIMGCQ
ncbi:MAG: hypothetical protein AB7T49_14630 [Oligoflexales bacterium]